MCELTIPHIESPSFIMFDTSAVFTGTVLIQVDDKVEMHFLYNNSSIFSYNWKKTEYY